MALITYKPPLGYRLPDGATRMYTISVHPDRLIRVALITSTFLAIILSVALVLLYAYPWIAAHMSLGQIAVCAILGTALSEVHNIWRRSISVTLPEKACVKDETTTVEAPAAEAPAERVSLLAAKMMPIHPSVRYDREMCGLTVSDRLRAYVDGLDKVLADTPAFVQVDPRLASLTRGTTLH